MARVRPPAQNHTKLILLVLLIAIILIIKFTSQKVTTTLEQRFQTPAKLELKDPQQEK